MPRAYPTLEVKLEGLLKGFEELHDEPVSVGVAVVGPAAAYAEVWEWGNVRQTKKGPRTVLGTNPDGESVWLSSQAPNGYIRVNEDKYLGIVKIELEKVKFSSPDGAAMKRELQDAGKRIMEQVADVIREAAPVDTGQLRSSWVVVTDEAELGGIDQSRRGALDIGE